MSVRIRQVVGEHHEPCSVRSPGGAPCTLPAGHTGWHHAADDNGDTIAEWPPDPTRERQTP